MKDWETYGESDDFTNKAKIKKNKRKDEFHKNAKKKKDNNKAKRRIAEIEKNIE